MGFMNSYKRLDNLCRDMNGVGVTGYIDDMKNEPKGSFCVLGWQADFNQLRKYRHIRNRIAHENDVDEAQVCSDRDIAWLENFYQRIIKQTDPLALCYKATRPPLTERRIQRPNEQKNPAAETRTDTGKNTGTDSGAESIVACMFVVLAIVIVFILCYR